MSSNPILWATALVMLAGGLLILATGKRRTSSEGLHTVLHGIVPIIAACSYLAMATGQGLVMLPTNEAVAVGAATPTRVFYFARYIDWAFTTPLLLVSLGFTAMRHLPKRHGAIVGAVLADVMMIVTAFAFGASELGWTKWTWFIVSCVAFLGVYYAIWKPQMEANTLERDDVQATYKRNATILSVVWLVYPVILAVAPDGLNIVSDAVSVLVIAILDVIAKVIYGYMSVMSDTKATERDLAEDRPDAVAMRRTA
ncbi:rhodopsin [Methylobacterium sp. WL30]|uniref:bacteriorhodopsin n=1 Tax=unclassified Methylobacterium TaxID=2615210 RepID=UPI0011CBB04C|nr:MULTISPECIES: bacteriorhodopsin [unclassified Methylobacterium]TXN34573.1 rhodopsin [Methylobacterium sp. WL93]TXN49826.1 rhodopsin [Methylobacterium sp. WL119]TXN63402.1 rhodopsin [Methylobacterium sp. WL30]